MAGERGDDRISVGAYAFLRIGEDKVSITLDWVPALCDRMALRAAVAQALSDLKVDESAWRDLDTLLAEDAAPADAPCISVVVARGEAPKPPVHGRIAWTGDYFATGFAVDPETGRFDYRRRVGDPNVKAGQLLARVVPPTEGEPGRSVFGHPVPPPRAKTASVSPGKNVRESGAQEYYAERTGRVRWSGGVLSVDDLLDIAGSVGLETGHVRHPGAVVVKGDVEEGAELIAEGDIEVHGMIEGAQVRCGGNLYVHGGIVAGQGCRVVAAGDVRARFITHAEVYAEGDIEVERGIEQARAHARGNVLVPQGRIGGGQVCAGGWVVVSQAGTPATMATTVLSGVDDAADAECADLQRQIREDAEMLCKMQRALTATARSGKALSAEQKVALKAVLERRAQVARELDAARERLKELQHMHRGGILVGQQIHSDTLLGMGVLRLKVDSDLVGPLRAEVVDDAIKLLTVNDFARRLVRIKEERRTRRAIGR